MVEAPGGVEEERKYWYQHNIIPRRKPGKGKTDFLSRSESGKSTGRRYPRCEKVDGNGEAPGDGEAAVRGSRAEEREQWDNVVDRWG